MNKALSLAAMGALAVAMSAPGVASAKGCLKGAAVGGVAGHVAGHHGLIGAAAGCAFEHHREKVRDRNAAQPDVPSRDNRVPNRAGDPRMDTSSVKQ